MSKTHTTRRGHGRAVTLGLVAVIGGTGIVVGQGVASAATEPARRAHLRVDLGQLRDPAGHPRPELRGGQPVLVGGDVAVGGRQHRGGAPAVPGLSVPMYAREVMPLIWYG